ncbi:hypothetical protein ACWIB8_04315 [Corynebacterium flavescens]|uniref:hypothetical protein n=1 Tax=Corynebacterium flavescens TaxID=28028 RepID=UPI00264718E0|nr:hypothetical protein [Corynebacterium flavescens]MDN6099119.1 hypothetical protein [Corynebacterium flavescens]MDN6200245.1 hypothetical protein [Corynebacterium flavescens]MDN6226463.1 hypothetical protein [Corynebacterium flavescens]MDN6236403.1 hypothetical protein [Corynebacterium flavescens]MDN6431658.1 hypothetical protein [Corynebacterium flavescens]
MSPAEIFEAIIRVAGLALAFGAGIPILFALGMRCMTGDPIRNSEGVIVGDTAASPQMKVLGWSVYGILALVIVVAILWIAKDSLNHYFGLSLFS